MSLALGTKLGPYEITALIGAGGMGEVYRAKDSRLGREVAIKVLPSALSKDPERLQRFEQEARAAGALNHPSITAVYDIGTHEGSLYVVSELLEGETLRSRLASGPLPPRKASDYAVQIARGLSAAHGKGIVHRDLKPENLFVTKDGRVKILDFGLAKLTLTEAGGAPLTEMPTAAADTEPGVVLGTLGYMSPEQVRGQTVDSRSDIFSFGAVLYEMLCGKRAFTGSSAADTMSAILMKEPPDLMSADPGIPQAFERIVRHCLEKNPEERFQSARDAAFDLEDLSGVSGAVPAAAALSVPSRKVRPGVLAAGVLLLVGTLAAGVLVGNRIARTSPPSYQQVTYGHGVVGAARFAPDGQTILYTAAWAGGPLQLFLKRPESPDSLPVGPAGAELLAVSRTGEMALSLNCRPGRAGRFGVCDGTLARALLTGGSLREVLENVQQADWTPDGSNLALVRDVGAASRLEFPTGKVLYETRGHVSFPRFSPKGDRIAFFDHPLVADDRGSVAVVDLSGKKRTLTTNWPSVQGLAWSPGGEEIWFTASPSGPMRALYGVTLSGRLRQIARVPGAIRLHDVTKDGRVLVTRESIENGVFALAPGATRERDLSWLEYSSARDISADGKTVLFEEQSAPAGPNYAVCVRGTDGSPVIRLGEGLASAISHDGKWVLSKLPPPGEPYVLLPTGPGEPRRAAYDGIESYARGIFLPGDREILFRAKRAREPFRLYRGSLAGGNAHPVSREVTGQGLIVSPDGRRAVATGPEGTAAIYPLDAGPDSPSRPIPGATPADVPIQWSDDGRSIYVRRGSARVFLLDLETGRSRLWKEIMPADPAGAAFGNIRITPDGKAYAYSLGRTLSQLYLVDGLK